MLVGGADVGEAMVAHPGVDKIQFVGSGATAKKVLRSAADTLKPCGLELGGKSAVLVFADADLQQAARRGLSGAMSSSGQGCVNGRSEERRVGKACGRTCRARWLPNHSNNNIRQPSTYYTTDTA